MPQRAESTFMSTMILVALAIVISSVMLGYVSSIVAYYRDQAEVVDLLQSEALNTVVNVISYDNATQTLWLLFRRLDHTSSDFYVMLVSNSRYLECDEIYVYDPASDTDGVMCNSKIECSPSVQIYSGPLSNVYLVWEGVITDLASYAREAGYPRDSSVKVCRVINACRLTGSSASCRESTMVRVKVPEGTTVLRVLVAVIRGDRPYIASIYEVFLK